MGYDQQFESWVCLEILFFIVFKWSDFYIEKPGGI